MSPVAAVCIPFPVPRVFCPPNLIERVNYNLKQIEHWREKRGGEQCGRKRRDEMKPNDIHTFLKHTFSRVFFFAFPPFQ